MSDRVLDNLFTEEIYWFLKQPLVNVTWWWGTKFSEFSYSWLKAKKLDIISSFVKMDARRKLINNEKIFVYEIKWDIKSYHTNSLMKFHICRFQVCSHL